MVVSAIGTYREEFTAATRQNRILAGNLPLYHSAIGDQFNRNSLCEIWLSSVFHVE